MSVDREEVFFIPPNDQVSWEDRFRGYVVLNVVVSGKVL